ncbi:MAG: SDR family NAD(P)-dependent oxidoreductase [Paracoccaceae bacterium]|nr:SDR family NAD(P)-dependent oxidoreductase [Paracoccaceae bacterium]
MIELSLSGVAVVTGAAKGIGQEIARTLAKAGARVALVDVDLASAREIALEIGGMAYACDVTDKAAVEATAREIQSDMGAVRYLINNAGIVSPPGDPFTENSEEDWDKTFAVNVKGGIFWAGALKSDLEAQQGRIVNITSIVGVIAAPFLPPYSVSKSAANGMTRVLARQFASKQVTVNAIAPGYVWSPLWEDLGMDIAKASDCAFGENATDVFQGRVDSLVPMKRAQTPEDIAACTAFLCSDLAKNITGQIIGVDGGITI